MRVRHPYALEDRPPAPDARVHYGGRRETAVVDEGGIFEVPDSARSRLESWADGYGYNLDELIVGEDREFNQQSGGEDAEVLVNDEPEVCGTEMSDGTVCERPADECPYHREED